MLAALHRTVTTTPRHWRKQPLKSKKKKCFMASLPDTCGRWTAHLPWAGTQVIKRLINAFRESRWVSDGRCGGRGHKFWPLRALSPSCKSLGPLLKPRQGTGKQPSMASISHESWAQWDVPNLSLQAFFSSLKWASIFAPFWFKATCMQTLASQPPTCSEAVDGSSGSGILKCINRC